MTKNNEYLEVLKQVYGYNNGLVNSIVKYILDELLKEVQKGIYVAKVDFNKYLKGIETNKLIAIRVLVAKKLEKEELNIISLRGGIIEVGLQVNKL